MDISYPSDSSNPSDIVYPKDFHNPKDINPMEVHNQKDSKTMAKLLMKLLSEEIARQIYNKKNHYEKLDTSDSLEGRELS